MNFDIQFCFFVHIPWMQHSYCILVYCFFFTCYTFWHAALLAYYFFTYYEFRHTSLLAYCFFFRISWTRTYCSFDVLSFFHMLWIRTYCITLLAYCFFSHIINLDILLFWHTVFFTYYKFWLFFWRTLFCILWIRTYCSFDIQFFFSQILWI